MKPYKKIFLLSVLCTIALFAMDKGPWVFTLRSVLGYIIVGSVYVGSIFFVAMALYYIVEFVRKKYRRS
ncbi:MAG: hypothetical protein JWQ38_2907 [Flavipsychrobacter sp.]|nr:hypothetical protein [Flavipsychrobacter sp.]